MTPVTVLALITFPGDRQALKNIISHSNWDLRLAASLQEAKTALRDRAVGVLISDRRLSTGECWTDLLSTLETLVIPPSLIVADACADAHVWAEVFNLGGYDLIFKPFESAEVAPHGKCGLALMEASIRIPDSYEKAGLVYCRRRAESR